MSDRKLAKAVRTLIRQISRLSRSMTKALMTWLLRLALVGNRRRRYATGGFVLPTTVLLILVVSLTTGALTYRAFNSSTRTIGETQNRVIYNAATPAVDRARAKLDYLFDDKKDPRYPGGVPSGNLLTSMLLNEPLEGAVIGGVKAGSQITLDDGKGGSLDPYTFPSETRLDINGDGKNDNAWYYRADTNGDGDNDATIVYSLVFATPIKQETLLTKELKLKANGEKLKKDDTHVVSYTRNGPLSNAKASGCGTGTSKVEEGWYEDPTNTSILRKNFQIDALVIPDGKGVDPKTPTAATVPGALATLELQQDRQISRGNKWGAWFRNDLEIFPGAKFNWNGAMHTEGSLIIGNDKTFEAYLVSAPASCLFYESASEISVTKSPETSTFTGLVLSGKMLENKEGGENKIHIHKPKPDDTKFLTPATDSSLTGKTPSDIALNPEELQKNNGYQTAAGGNNRTNLDSNLSVVDPGQEFLTKFEGRIRMKAEKAPYVDDGYRADDRFGPKQKYNAEISIPGGATVGQSIATSSLDKKKKDDLIGNNVTGTDKSAVGLDGYWERRGRNEGLRILVGQRLELGNAFGWVAPQNRPASKQDPAATPAVVTVKGFSDFRNNAYTATYNAPANLAKFGATTPLAERPDPDTSDNEGDPLYPPEIPPTETSLTHEAQQRRALRDNLSAVQATAVYHAAVNKDEPIACIATTSHFATPFAIERSINFVPTTFKSGSANTDLLVDFFNGRGTNGMEFTPPSVTDITGSGPMNIALRNLANFAGDPDGAFPPTKEDGKIHPDPYQTMWGNFSNLKRAISLLDSGSYDALSPADKTYLHTAACTLGMLAYNVDTLQKFDPTSADNGPAMADLGALLADLMNGKVEDGEVLPKEQLSTFGYSSTGTYDQEKYNPRDYDRVPAEAFLGKVREMRLGGDGTTTRVESDSVVRLAELIFTSMQVRRDRTYGFRPSPAANTWNYNPFVTHDLPSTSPAKKPLLWSSACDPNSFAIGPAGSDGAKTGGAGAALIPFADDQRDLASVEQARLGLSRLCGTVLPSGAVHDFPGDTKYPARDGALTANLPKKNDAGTFKTMTPAKESLNFPFEPAVDPAFAAAAPLKDISETKPYTLAQVTPKWPALYYIFPEVKHDHDGGVDPIAPGSTLVVDHRQPGNTTDVGATLTAKLNTLPAAFQPWEEPYITKVTTAYEYKPVKTGAVTGYNAARVPYTANSVFLSGAVDDPGTTGYDVRGNVQLAYKTFGGFLPDNLPVSDLALTPVTNTSSSKLPIDDPTGAVLENIKPNRILTASGVKVVPFLDRVLFNGREGLPSRVLDLDIGMLRRTRPDGQGSGTDYAPGDVWLPASGLVYAFREDAVREDDIYRPKSGTLCASTGKPCTNATVPGSETDPSLTDFGISLKPVDFVADPIRRPHGFRLRNATQLRRHKTMVDSGGANFNEDKNIRGIDFVSDNSVYVMGPYNLHQADDKGSKEDNGDPDLQDTAERIEEFDVRITSGDDLYDYDTFYGRKTTDVRFADPAKDRWRPSAILADATIILSDNFCDGSALDNFMTAGAGIRDVNISSTTYSGSATTAAPNADNLSFVDNFYPYGKRAAATFKGPAVYNDSSKALYGPGCTDGKRTSFLNQNRPETQPPAGWSWARENPADIFSPIKISRNGNGFLIPPARTVAPTPEAETDTEAQKAQKVVEKMIAQKPRVMADYDIGVLSGDTYYTTSDASKDGEKRALQEAKSTRVNTILVSGIVPSRANQSYGGMHNFPRFLENWGTRLGVSGKPKNLWFAGSFLQLSFSNAATAPFDIGATEPNGGKPTGTEQIPYYEPPNRLWGYDPALLLAPAGPISSRFVSTDITRSEFYSEVAANDPYIKNLCKAVEGSIVKNLKCPT